MHAAIRAIEYFLPEAVLSNEMLQADFPELLAAKIEQKTGISTRHLTAPGECASDLAEQASRKLLASGICLPGEIDFILLCTQSPDYFLPTTACLLQHRLGIPSTSGALDFNLGCSGYIYGLGLAKGLVESGQSRNVLLLTAETYSKYMDRGDRNVRVIFGDAAAATLVSSQEGQGERIGPFVYGTDGSGAANLMVRSGASRQQIATQPSDAHLFMNGPEIFNFTIRTIPACIDQFLEKAQLRLEDIDLWVFHQANSYMLNHLREKLNIPAEKFYLNMSDCGNTVSSTIPIALRRAQTEGRLHTGDKIALVGFGVGYSWGAVLIQW